MLESEAHKWDWIEAYTPSVVETCRAYLDEARSAVATVDGSGSYSAAHLEKVRGRLELAQEGFQHTDTWYEMRRAARAGEWSKAIGLAEEVIAHIESTKGSEPQVFIEWLALRHIYEQEMAILTKRMRSDGR